MPRYKKKYEEDPDLPVDIVVTGLTLDRATHLKSILSHHGDDLKVLEYRDNYTIKVVNKRQKLAKTIKKEIRKEEFDSQLYQPGFYQDTKFQPIII